MQTETANNSVVVDVLSSAYKLRFDDDISLPSYYRFELEALAQAGENDRVEARVNTHGGSFATGIEVANAIFTCRAPVEGILRSNCHSCGSIIFLACHTHDVGLASEMLIHTGEGDNYGTPTQSIERAKSYKRQVRALFETVYKGFLSEDELNKLIEEDKEFIFAGEEIAERLQVMYKYREGVQEDQTNEFEEMMWQENNRMVAETLETLNISDEEKAVFNKVKTLLDNSLEDCDNAPTEDSLEDDNNSSGIPLKDSDGDIIGVIDNTAEYPLVDTFAGHIVDFEDDITEDRESLLLVMSLITGRNYSKWATTALYNSFKREIERQIKENKE